MNKVKNEKIVELAKNLSELDEKSLSLIYMNMQVLRTKEMYDKVEKKDKEK